jgi:hypothetical protein
MSFPIEEEQINHCTCDRSSELHYAITRYIAGFDEEHNYTCEYCFYNCNYINDESMEFASIEEIVKLFKTDPINLLNIKRGPNNVGLFDMITHLKEILDFAHGSPYLKCAEHNAIMFRHQELTEIYTELSIKKNAEEQYRAFVESVDLPYDILYMIRQYL